MKCRHCDTELTLPLIDLGSSPSFQCISNHSVTESTRKMVSTQGVSLQKLLAGTN